MYHGSFKDFNVFIRPTCYDGIYFASDPEYASGYARVKASLFNGVPILYVVNLDISHPYEVNGEDDSLYEKYTQRGFDINKLAEKGFDGITMRFKCGDSEAMVFSSKQINIVRKAIIKEAKM